MHDPIGLPHHLVARSPIEHRLDQGAQALAVLGGIVFVTLIMMSLVSIVGRKLGLVTVTGDIELMQAGTAFAVSCFMPYCTLLDEHLRVEFFTENLSAARRSAMDGVGGLLLAVVLGLLTWRTGLQVIDMTDSGEVTPLLSLPMWILVAAVVPPLALTVLCALFRAAADLGLLARRSSGPTLPAVKGERA